jgi:16S rRNA G527 N7-methylase RsmG
VSDYSIVIENMPTDFTLVDLEIQFNKYLEMLKEENEGINLNEIKVVRYNEGKPFYLN